MAAYSVLISLFFFEIAVGELISNVTLAQDGNEDLPVVREGDPCTPGLSYKMDCNRCHCNSASKLICTKMACVDWSTILRQRSGKLRQGKKSNNPSKKGSKNDEKVSSGKSSLPQLPEGSCVPGKMYRKKCRRCFCNDKGHASCSAFPNGACLLQNVRSPTDVRSPFKREELKNLQTLSSASDKCEAGKTYKVRCNNCICTEKNDLMCTRALCLSFEDINRITAVESSGKKCSENELTKTMCVECKCSNGKTVCQRILNCVSDTRFRLSKGSNDTLKMQLDPYKDKCVPLSIYTNNCNRCYCQPNGSLRCTQKTCLNYSQTKSLEKQFLNSQKLHGQ